MKRKFKQFGKNKAKKVKEPNSNLPLPLPPPPPPLPPITKVKKAKKGRFGKQESFEDKMEKLSGGRFRQLNEMLYTTTGEEALSTFSEDPSLFNQYHEGFQNQVSQWPEDPLDSIIQKVREEKASISQAVKSTTNRKIVVADLGCGIARMANELETNDFVVHSFDLVSVNERVVACNISHTPLKDASCDIVVFCLSLMGIDSINFIVEANRILVENGLLLITETKSRIESNCNFMRGLARIGFGSGVVNDDNQMFVSFAFRKKKLTSPINEKTIKSASQIIDLKPCLYKKR